MQHERLSFLIRFPVVLADPPLPVPRLVLLAGLSARLTLRGLNTQLSVGTTQEAIAVGHRYSLNHFYLVYIVLPHVFEDVGFSH